MYPEAGKQKPIGLIYTALKGAGEAGEFAEKVGKAIRDEGFATEREELTQEKRQLLIKEIGDSLWYCAAQARELGVTLEEIARHNIMKLSDRAERDMIKGSGDER